MRRLPHSRGQAAVELALGLIVMVTIMMFGIHFAEIGYLGAKVHEAAASTLWDSTAYRSYQFGVWYDSGKIATPTAQTNGARYADFDGRASAVHAAPIMAMTQAQPMAVTCKKPGVLYPLQPLAPAFAEAGGAACSAQADISPIRIGTNFLNDANGFFKEAQKTRPTTTLCSSGRLTAGNCGSLSLLLGDDALNNGVDALECALQKDSPIVCANTQFYTVTNATWDQSMQKTAGWASGYTGAPEAWARNIADGLLPGRITGFYLSFRGEPLFTEPVEAGENGGTWDTSPFNATLPTVPTKPYATAYGARVACAGAGYCYLGRYNCN